MAKGRFFRVILWVLLGVFLLVGALVASIVVPILSSSPQGSSGQTLDVEGFPLSVTALGDDGRSRVLSAEVVGDPDRLLDTLTTGDRVVVSGSGYNPRFGIYVAICQVPADVSIRPGPCLGGVPSTEAGGEPGERAIEYAPSNWVNDDWAWRLFGARSFDSREEGTFSAYLEIVGAADENVDCRAVRCGLYTRNDHTALDDRVQDLYLPVAFTR